MPKLFEGIKRNVVVFDPIYGIAARVAAFAYGACVSLIALAVLAYSFTRSDAK